MRRKLALFGSGPLALFATGPHRHLAGRLVHAFPPQPAPARAEVRGSARRFVRPRSPFVPALVEGQVVGPRARSVTDVAVAVDGRIGAVTRTVLASGGVRFSAVVAESVLRPGVNELKLYAVSSRRGRPVLAPLG